MMNKYFIMGFISAMLIMFAISCTSTLEAEGWSNCGDSQYNPCYVKIVDQLYYQRKTKSTKKAQGW